MQMNTIVAGQDEATRRFVAAGAMRLSLGDRSVCADRLLDLQSLG